MTAKGTPAWAASVTLTRPIASTTCSFRRSLRITPFRRFASNPMRCGWANVNPANTAAHPQACFATTAKRRRCVNTNYRTPVYGLTISGKRTLMPTSSGIAVIDGDAIKRYLVDRTTDGRMRVVEAPR
jgi:hypothetical protein